MAKNLNVFQTEVQYKTAQSGLAHPDVSYSTNNDRVRWLNTPPVRYLYSDLTVNAVYDSGKTVIGLEIIPAEHTPDGVPRYMALTQVGDVYGSSGDTTLQWSNNTSTTLLTHQYTEVPTITSGSVETVNYGTIQGMESYGSLPSTNGNGHFSGLTNTRGERYATGADKNHLAPSLYGNSGERNPLCNITTGTNVLMDFSGYENTQALRAGGITVPAATAAWNYASKNSLSGVQSYLPAAGELAYIVPNFRRIQAVLTSLGSKAATLPDSNIFWSSSERSASNGWDVNTNNGTVANFSKANIAYVRPFLKITQ